MTGDGATRLDAGQRVEAAAIRTLYRGYKRLKHAGSPLPVEAEYPHKSGADPQWNESLYFNFTDPATGLGGYTRIGVVPNQPSDIGVMMLFAGGSRLLVTNQQGRAVADGKGWRIGALAFERVEPLWTWRLRFEGEMGDLPDSRDLPTLDLEKARRTAVSVDLTFTGMAPCFNFKDADPAALAEMVVAARSKLSDVRKVSRISSEHYEQVGRLQGGMRWDGEDRPFDGSGQRDHSWGVRDWSAPTGWTWLTGQFGDRFAFNLSRIRIASLDLFNGYTCRGGKNYPVRRALLDTEFEEDGRTQRRVSFEMEDNAGERFAVSGEVQAVIPLDLRQRGHDTLVNEGLALWRWEGESCYGVAEYLHQL